MKERLTEKFVPEDSELLRSRLYSQSNARSAHASCDSISFDEVRDLHQILQSDVW